MPEKKEPEKKQEEKKERSDYDEYEELILLLKHDLEKV